MAEILRNIPGVPTAAGRADRADRADRAEIIRRVPDTVA